MRIVLLCLVSGYVIFLPGVVGKALEKWHVAEWVGAQKNVPNKKDVLIVVQQSPPGRMGGSKGVVYTCDAYNILFAVRCSLPLCVCVLGLSKLFYLTFSTKPPRTIFVHCVCVCVGV